MTVSHTGQCSVFRDQEAIHFNVQLPVKGVSTSAIAVMSLDGEPCVVLGSYGNGSGVYILHAVTLELLHSLPYKKYVECICIDATGDKVFFGTESGLI
jgi:hypothetical protein